MGKSNRVALVIGNGAYPQGPLKNPLNDAALITWRLKQRGFAIVGGASSDYYPTGHSDGMDVTRARAFELIETFLANLSAGATAVIYYAGHALQISDKNFLMPVDATLNEGEPALELVEIKPRIEQASEIVGGQGHVVVFLDACRNNPFGEQRMREIIARSARRPDREHGQDRPAELPVNLSRGGLSSLKMARNTDLGRTFIGFATAPGDVAYDGEDNARNSPFAKALGEQLAVRGLEVRALFSRVQREVQDAAARMGCFQDPWSETNLDRDLFFYPRSLKPILALGGAGLVVGILVSWLLFERGNIPDQPPVWMWFLGALFGLVSAWGTLTWGSQRPADALFAFLGPLFGFAVGLAVLKMIPEFTAVRETVQRTPQREFASYVFGVATVVGLAIYMAGLTMVRIKQRLPRPRSALGWINRGLAWLLPFLIAGTLLAIDYMIYNSTPYHIAVTLCALLAGILYAASAELGCRPQAAIFRGFGPFTGSVSVGLIMAALFAVYAWLQGQSKLAPEQLQYVMIAFGGVWHMLLGAQLGYCFALYIPDYIRRRM